VLILALLCFSVFGGSQVSQAQQPSQQPHAEKILSKKNEGQTGNGKSLPNPTTITSQEASATEQHREAEHSQEAIAVERQLAKFTLYLVLVGFLQFAILSVQAILFWQQKRIMSEHKMSLEQLASAAGDNVGAIKAQGVVMEHQLSAMQGQLNAIESQNRTMEESVGVARESANIAQLAAEAGIEKERARLKIVVEKINPQTTLNGTICHVENYGLSPAFISDFRVRFLYCLPRDIVPDYSMCRQILYSESIQAHARTNSMLISFDPPEFLMTDDSVMKIKKEEAFFHFYGFVKYRDVFKRDRRATIHVRWTMRWGGQAPGMIMQWWEPVGELAQNADE
jgi:hypothetical protein